MKKRCEGREKTWEILVLEQEKYRGEILRSFLLVHSKE
jgi:hypothetical protein